MLPLPLRGGSDGGVLTTGLCLAVGGQHPQGGGACVKEDQEILGWCPNADLPKVERLQRKVCHPHCSQALSKGCGRSWPTGSHILPTWFPWGIRGFSHQFSFPPGVKCSQYSTFLSLIANLWPAKTWSWKTISSSKSVFCFVISDYSKKEKNRFFLFSQCLSTVQLYRHMPTFTHAHIHTRLPFSSSVRYFHHHSPPSWSHTCKGS